MISAVTQNISCMIYFPPLSSAAEIFVTESWLLVCFSEVLFGIQSEY